MNEKAKRKLIIGSRESALAMLQSEMVKRSIEETDPEIEVSILPMKTTGDKILDRHLSEVGGKGLFVKELDKALRDRRSDISVDSLKDMPMEVPEDLPLLAFSAREDPRDALVLPAGCDEWDQTKPVGTSSKRRIIQLRRLYPDLEFALVRGNLQTRLRKLDAGEFGALILAAAGLKRMGLGDRISRCFSPDEIIPAAGQGILAVQGRAGEPADFLAGIADESGEWAALTERAFVRELNGGCSSPIGAYAEREGSLMRLRGLYYSEEKETWITGTDEAEIASKDDLTALGARLAVRLRKEVEEA